MKHPITPEMIRRFVAIIAKTRSGKTFAIKGAIEELLDAGEQVVVLDPTSAYYGLRLDRDGKTPAHPNLLIVGGDYGDIPIVPTAEAAAALADVIFDQGVSCVIDLGSLVGELVEWSTAFATRFYQRSNKGQPVTLVIDEAHEFAPKDAKPGNGKKVSAGDMLVAFRRLATGGGSRGIRLVALTQRPGARSRTSRSASWRRPPAGHSRLCTTRRDTDERRRVRPAPDRDRPPLGPHQEGP